MIFYKQSALCKLAYKYGSDKCPKIKHTYTPYYNELFGNRKNSIKKVLEIGVGDKKLMAHVAKIKGSYSPGASLLMWQDYFPKAQIFGVDISPKAMIKDKRITTFIANQTSRNDLMRLIRKTGSDIDIVIDDGSKIWIDKITTCNLLMPMLKKDVTYIIEDVKYPGTTIRGLSKYDCSVPDIAYRRGDNRLILVRNKNYGSG